MARVPTASEPERVALVYDRLNSWGGAERVLTSLLEIYPNATLFSSVHEERSTPWLKNTTIKTSFLQNFSWLRTKHRWLGWLMPLAFETLSLDDYDLVISVSSEAAKAVLTKPEQLHVCYLLTPTRYLWSHEQAYRNELPICFRPFVGWVQKWLQRWDRMAARRPDVIIPISKLVQQRVKKYYSLDTEDEIYPGYRVLSTATKPKNAPTEPFIFAWGRHVRYKRFDVIIEYAEQHGMKLLLAGEGPETLTLKKMAANNTVFLGHIADSELAWYLQNAVCAVFPQIEDFGIAPLEALSQGCPVIVHRDSGVSERLTEDDGVFIDQTTSQELVPAMQKIQAKSWNRLDIQSRARQYAEESFQAVWKKKVQMLWTQHQQQLKGSL